MPRKKALESKFQSDLKKELKERFKGCMVFKTDEQQVQGIPDLLILYKDRWAALECKREEDSSHRPNQDYYVDLMNKMSFASFISPENKERVLDEMEQSWRTRRNSRIS